MTYDDSGVRCTMLRGGTSRGLFLEAADLPIPDDRLPLVAAHLSEWLVAANDLSRKMSAPEHLTVTPVTVFLAPAATTEIAE